MPRGDFNIARNVFATGESSWTSGSGTIKYFPLERTEFDDLPQIAREYVFNLSGPTEPVFEKDAKLITFGSCFAREISRWLTRNGNGTKLVYVPTGLNNSFAVRQYIEWCTTGNRSTDAYWYDRWDNTWEPEVEHQTALKEFKECSGFVLTFGLSEVWRDKQTGGVFWRGVPSKKFDPRVHECVVSSVADNLDNMRRIYELIREHAGADKHIIYTLSPIPLNATFLERSIFESDCVSKSVLRVALDEFFKLQLTNAWYWPSFEFIRWVGAHTKANTIGVEDGSSRDISAEMVEIIIDNFARKFFK